ncbi:hypothetical protein ACRRTK_018741 [Alexandromys fortis]
MCGHSEQKAEFSSPAPHASEQLCVCGGGKMRDMKSPAAPMVNEREMRYRREKRQENMF